MAKEEGAARAQERTGSIEQRTKRALNEVLDFVKGMDMDKVSGLLNDVAKKYERRGPSMAEVLVVGKWDDAAFKDKHNELTGLVQIVHALERERLPRAEGGYIIKKLAAIKQFYVPEEPGKEKEG